MLLVFVNGSYPWMNLKYCVLRLRGYYTHYKGVSIVNMCIIRWHTFPPRKRQHSSSLRFAIAGRWHGMLNEMFSPLKDPLFIRGFHIQSGFVHNGGKE